MGLCSKRNIFYRQRWPYINYWRTRTRMNSAIVECQHPFIRRNFFFQFEWEFLSRLHSAQFFTQLHTICVGKKRRVSHTHWPEPTFILVRCWSFRRQGFNGIIMPKQWRRTSHPLKIENVRQQKTTRKKNGEIIFLKSVLHGMHNAMIIGGCLFPRSKMNNAIMYSMQ